MRKLTVLMSLTAFPALVLTAQTPLAKPLSEFDELVAQLKTSSVVGEPIHAGDTTVVPFASVKFGVGGGALMTASGGGLGIQSVPLGVLIVEGDTVRLERFATPEAKPSIAEELIKAIHDRKVVIGNGLNIGSFSGNAQTLEPIIQETLEHTTIVGNGLNIGGMKVPKSDVPPPGKKDRKPADKK